MALHLPIGPLKTQDANPVPTSPLADDIATAPLGPVKGVQPQRPVYTCHWIGLIHPC